MQKSSLLRLDLPPALCQTLRMRTALAILSRLTASTLVVPAKDYLIHTFHRTQLSDKFWCEGATFGDLNRDGKGDIISGPYWYEGPD
jgi:hypothetical protein